MDTAYQQYSQLVEQVVKDRITGGTMTGFDGPIDFSKNQNIIASNGLIHDELTKAILF